MSRRSTDRGPRLSTVVGWAVVAGALLVAGLDAFVDVDPLASGGCVRDRGFAASQRSDLILLWEHITWYSLDHADGAWPPYDGKNFVLSVVATSELEWRRRSRLDILFPTSGIPDDVGPEDYAAITHDTLRSRRFPHLTQIAGRRNTYPKWRTTVGWEDEGTPLFAVRYQDGVVVAYSDGEVCFHARAELGLAPDEPIRFGDAAKSDLLRCLSEE